MKIISFILIFFLFLFHINKSYSDNIDFSLWLDIFKKRAIAEGVSKNTVNDVMNNAVFLPKVIQYDRFQPEFYEDTLTYINKRVNKNKVIKGTIVYKKNSNLINEIENKFSVEKELLLSLMGIETNFGKYLGKMDIISSLATLSFDKRRSEFFTNELITVLDLVDKDIIDHKILFGSWAGAFGFFQFMPSTMKNYAIDYDNNGSIDLKNNNDAYASAGNYLNQIGWKTGQPCFIRVNLSSDIPKRFLNVSAKKLHNKQKLKLFSKFITNIDDIDNKYENLHVAIITPDKDIIPDADTLNPAFVVFDNYEIILQWNRSLRFALAVCTLKDKFHNELQ